MFRIASIDPLMHHCLGTANESIPTKTLLLNTAREPDQAALFNHASMAHSNHFFFNCLVRLPLPLRPPASIAQAS